LRPKLIPLVELFSNEIRYTVEGRTFYFTYPKVDGNGDIDLCTKNVHSSDAEPSEIGCSCYVIQTHPGTPLQFAALGGSEAMVRLLLKAGADINEDGGIIYRDTNTEEILCADGTALELARQKGHVGIVNMLLESLYNLYVESDV
jgi:hypothetical protein